MFLRGCSCSSMSPDVRLPSLPLQFRRLYKAIQMLVDIVHLREEKVQCVVEARRTLRGLNVGLLSMVTSPGLGIYDPDDAIPPSPNTQNPKEGMPICTRQ